MGGSLVNSLEGFGRSFASFVDKSGDEIKSAFNTVGEASDFALDSVGDFFSFIPELGKGIDDAFDRTGDKAKSFFQNAGKSIDDEMDGFSDKINKLTDKIVGKAVMLDMAELLGMDTTKIILDTIFSPKNKSDDTDVFFDDNGFDDDFFTQDNGNMT